jgi:pimeloyl-ACP methyl ester carboxylesterase
MDDVGRRSGVYGGWSHAGRERIFVRVPTELKRRAGNGNGPVREPGTTPIVLVHGFCSSRALRPLIKALGTRRAVYAPDLPGFGLSEHPVRPLDVPGLADALRRWIFDNDLAPAIVIGVSFGCQVAVDLAARHPSAVARLALVSPTFDPQARTPARLAMRWARDLPRSSPRLAPAVVHDLIDAGPWRSLRTIRKALDDPTEQKLDLIEAPTLVVRPEHDHLARPAWTELLAELIPNAELVVLVRSGHSIGPRAATRLTALLAPFLAETEQAAWTPT